MTSNNALFIIHGPTRAPLERVNLSLSRDLIKSSANVDVIQKSGDIRESSFVGDGMALISLARRPLQKDETLEISALHFEIKAKIWKRNPFHSTKSSVIKNEDEPKLLNLRISKPCNSRRLFRKFRENFSGVGS